KAENAAVCGAEAPAFCDALTAFRDELLATGLAAEKKEMKTPITAHALHEKLLALKEACADFLQSKIDATASALAQVSCGEESDTAVREILESIETFDYEEAGEKIAALVQKLGAELSL
ncbi:MAG: hybrid sensor histidine kinase/response regulator, partial [Spirochaetales bacterium]|nr:hybrid sensor histidine kinase/response regulator [Spirochaetales bacterium]